jgi:hypothetical protein
MSIKTQVGFSQRIQLEWLERTAGLLLAGKERKEIQTALDDHLRDQLSRRDTEGRGNRAKSITILLKVWVSVQERLVELRDEALTHMRRLPVKDHLPFHWCMTMATYPFVGAVAATVGRLTRLQGTVAAAEAQRRLREQFGERETVSRAARRVLRCFVDWGVLEESGEKGIYHPTARRGVTDPELAAWLIEAALLSGTTDSGAVRSLADSPTLFPFTVSGINVTRLEANRRLEVFRQVDVEMVALRKSG